MKIIINILIFLIVLIIYLHITNFLQISQDLSINEMYFTNKLNFNEICKLKNPIIIYDLSINSIDILNYLEKNNYMLHIDNYKTNKINYNQFNSLLNEDISSSYLSFNNINKIDKVYRLFENNDFNIKPLSNAFSNYNLIISNKNSIINYHYNIYDRNILQIEKGSIELTLISPKFLSNFDFKVNIKTMTYHTKINEKELNKKNIPYKKIKLIAGNIINIPYKWIYKIEFLENSLLLNYSYVSSINLLCNCHNFLFQKIFKEIILK